MRNVLTFYILVPIIFAGEPETIGLFEVVKSGLFTDLSTWKNQIRPYGRCQVIVHEGFEVTLNQPILELNVEKFDVYGKMIIGSGENDDFMFMHATSMTVFNSGIVEDRTRQHKIFVPKETLWRFYPQATAIGTSLTLISFTMQGSTVINDRSALIEFNFQGSFTCGISTSGRIDVIKKFVWLLKSSGDFSDDSIYLGNEAPSESICESIDECELRITDGHTLTTESLQGEMKVKFSRIEVSSGASFHIGGSTSSSFKFLNQLALVVTNGGNLDCKASGNEISFMEGTLMKIHPGAKLIGTNVKISTLTHSGSSIQVGSSVTIGSNVEGPYTCAINMGDNIQTLSGIAAFVSASGTFNNVRTWLAAEPPSTGECDSPNGCIIVINTGFTLLTSDLVGELTVKVNRLTIHAGASLVLGASGLTSGFRFRSPIEINCFGTIKDGTSNTVGIFVPVGSIMNIFSSGSFISDFVTSLHKYDIRTGATVGPPLKLTKNLIGPYFVSAILTDSFLISTVGE